MENTNPNWTKEELKIYTLIYCANADFSESKVELDFIKSKVKSSDFDKIHSEFEDDNDYQSIQKIQFSCEEHGYTKDDTNSLFSEIKELFMRDKKYDVLEENLLIGLRHLLK